MQDDPTTAQPSPLLRRQEAAEYLRTVWRLPCEATTLAKLASIGGGPPFHKAGRIPLYPPLGLDAFARAKIGPLQASTSKAA